MIKNRGYKDDVCGDQYSLYISSYVKTAAYLAKRVGKYGRTVTELCCGIGINLIELTKVFEKVIGVDINNKVLSDCGKNVEMAGVVNKVKLLCGDARDDKLLANIKSDIAVYDIPYWTSKRLDDGSDLLDKNPNFKGLTKNIQKLITKDFVVFAPPNFDEDNLKGLGKYEYQKIYIDGKYDRNYIYFGRLVETEGVGEILF